MTDLRSDPVSLPPGSYDYDALRKATDAAAKGPKTKYEENIAAAVRDANESKVDEIDPRSTPGYVFQEVENADLGVTENIQVFDAKAAEKAKEEGAPAIAPQAATPPPASEPAAASKE